MESVELVRELMGESGVGWAEMGRRLGTQRQAVFSMLRGRDMQSACLSRYLGALGWGLFAAPLGSELPEGAVEIGGQR